MMPASLAFLGAAGTVTGSKFLLEVGGRRVLVECGLYQGLKELRLRNWQPRPVAASSIEHVVLTHAHIDHSGHVPRLLNDGFNGHVHATRATVDLLRILLPDSGHLEEEEAPSITTCEAPPSTRRHFLYIRPATVPRRPSV